MDRACFRNIFMNGTTPRYAAPSSGSIWNFLLGIWLIISPFVLAFTSLERAKWNNVAVGVAVGLLALSRMSGSRTQANWSWINILLGIWMIISPFVLGFSQYSTPLWNNVILGIFVAIAAWASSSAVHVHDVPQEHVP